MLASTYISKLTYTQLDLIERQESTDFILLQKYAHSRKHTRTEERTLHVCTVCVFDFSVISVPAAHGVETSPIHQYLFLPPLNRDKCSTTRPLVLEPERQTERERLHVCSGRVVFSGELA